MRLRGWMENLANQNISFLVSYAESDEADSLKKGFHIEVVTVKRNIAWFSQSWTRSNELLVSFTAPTKELNVAA